ncbi:MAG: tetratricopeptide repeat protein [Burkholderiales bacterium]
MVAVLCAFFLGVAPVALSADIGGYLEDQAQREKSREQLSAFDEMVVLARDGDIDSQYRLGMAHRNGWGTAKDPIAAATWLREAADRGHARAQYVLGILYELGEGVPPSDARAREWYEKAARQGHVEAQVGLAALLVNSKPSESALAEAFMWYEIAAGTGNLSAERGRISLEKRLPDSVVADVRQRASDWRPSIQ